MKHTCKEYGPTLLRIALGLLLIIPGMGKLINPAGIIGMLAGMGLPLAALLGWLVIIAEVVFGLALLVGYKTTWSVWPPFVVLFVATLMVVLPGLLQGGSPINLLFHVLALAGLVSVYFTGPGALSIDGQLQHN